MGNNKPHSKFVNIVDQIRQMIASDGLLSGDKLPSERELSERLAVGRSSVREALRALELLGLIETRRGEGTFLRDFSDHQFVRLISMFILQEERTKQDVRKTKKILESGCLSIVVQQPELESILQKAVAEMETSNFSSTDFFSLLMDASGNVLLKKIWIIVSDYEKEIEPKDRMAENKQGFYELIEKMRTKDIEAIHRSYRQL